MQHKETAIEVKVGALVLFSLLLFGGFVFVLGDFRFSEGHHIFIDFSNAGGLKTGADVRIAGYPAGAVDSIDFLGGRYDEEVGRAVYVRVRLSIDQGMASAIGDQATFVITTLGVLGEPYVEIINADPLGDPVPMGAKFEGTSPRRTDEIFQALYNGIGTITDFFQQSDLQRLLHEAANLAEGLDGLVERNSEHVSGAIASLDYILQENRDSIAPILENVEGASAEIRQLSAGLNRAIDGGVALRRTLRNLDDLMQEASDHAPETLSDLESTLDSIERVISEREDELSNSLANVDVLFENLVRISADLAELTEHVNSGQGTIGALLRDDEIYDDFREFIRELKRRPWRLLWRE